MTQPWSEAHQQLSVRDQRMIENPDAPRLAQRCQRASEHEGLGGVAMFLVIVGVVFGGMGWAAVADGAWGPIVPITALVLAGVSVITTVGSERLGRSHRQHQIDGDDLCAQGREILALTHDARRRAHAALGLLERSAPELVSADASTQIERAAWESAKLCLEARRIVSEAAALSEQTRQAAREAADEVLWAAWSRVGGIEAIECEAREIAHRMDRAHSQLEGRIAEVRALAEARSALEGTGVRMRGIREALEVLQDGRATEMIEAAPGGPTQTHAEERS